jgi:hypothetical protein
MATSNVSRLASVTARDGVNTRTKVNWATAVARPRETICRSDMIIGLGQLAVEQSYNGSAAWGDIMTDSLGKTERKPSRWGKAYNDYSLWEDMVNEPWKYGDDITEWLALNEKLITGSDADHVAAFWRFQMEREQAELAREQAPWRKAFKALARQAGVLGMKRWIDKDIKRIVAEVKAKAVKTKRAATKMQALVRGYQARCKEVHQDCCMCLSHRISPLKTEVGYMCRDCAADGPFTDLAPYDDWGWHRANYVEA